MLISILQGLWHTPEQGGDSPRLIGAEKPCLCWESTEEILITQFCYYLLIPKECSGQLHCVCKSFLWICSMASISTNAGRHLPACHQPAFINVVWEQSHTSWCRCRWDWFVLWSQNWKGATGDMPHENRERLAIQNHRKALLISGWTI